MTEQHTRTIMRLPPDVVARIAAGEMISRPAAALKELVENALDAGGRQITVEVREGLDRFLRIADDGCGMSSDELRLAVERYTTSKIRAEGDLLRIESLGFRGEALASIGEIARLTILTRGPADDHGWELEVAAGEIGELKAAARAQGTTATVEELFYNTPVRKRFLKSGTGELRLARATLAAYALATPGVSWRYEVDGKSLLTLPGVDTLRSRLAQVHGNKLADGLIEITWQENGLSLRGFVGIPELARAGSQHHTFFVNGRWVSAPWLGQAVRQGYGDLIPNRQNPWVVLFLVSPPDQVDVNLHPTKREVRFADERKVFGAVQRAVQSAVAKLLPRFYMSREGEQGSVETRSAGSQETPALTPEGALQGPSLFGSPRGLGGAKSGRRPVFGGGARGGDGRDHAERLYGPGEEGAGEAALGSDPAPADGEPAAVSAEVAAESSDHLVSLLQLHNRYVLAQTRKGLLIIDQHAAHERILYEQILDRMQRGDTGAQQLLFPVVVELDDFQMELLERVKVDLLRIGFDLEEFGGRSVLLRGTPPLWRARGEAELLRDLLDEAATMGLREGETAEGLARSFACRAAIKSGEPLSVEEMNQLVDALFATHRPHGDPHGRPTFVAISLGDLDRRFGRGGGLD